MEVFINRNSELLERFKNGDKTARDILCNENMGLVKKIALGFSKSGVPYEDLVQTGAIGLIKAIDNFDMSQKVTLSTYAVPMILGEIKRFLRDDGLIKVSRNIKQIASKGLKAREELLKTLSREPTIKEISAKCGIAPEDLAYAFDAVREPDSINREIYDNSEETYEDRLSSDSYEEHITDKILIEEMLMQVSAEERQVIVLRYFKDKSQQEIGKMLGISQVQVSRIEKRVFERIRKKGLI